MTNLTKAQKIKQIRELAESDLYSFIRLVAPYRVLGAIHKELIKWWTRSDALDNQLVLLPRDHGKSALIAYRVAWQITREPDTTFLYVSATADLAEKQLYFIKNILESSTYRKYWPEMIIEDSAKRERWTTSEIVVDHPLRKVEGVRDPTIKTAGITSNITGLHFKRVVLDDVVVRENAYTEEGRRKVASLYSLLASIESTGATEWVVGTRYHPKDLYNDLLSMEEEEYDEEGNFIRNRPVYEVFERVLEDSPNRDGDGEYLWPKQQRYDGKVFGFDKAERARKYAKYIDKTQFYAQYYNDPSDPTNLKLPPDIFEYYDKKFIHQEGGIWYFKDRRINVYAAMDFAFSTKIKADYTAIVVIGIDFENQIYVLDIDRFKTTSIKEMFDHLLFMFNKWEFKKLNAEVSVAQISIVNEFKDYMKSDGIFFSIEESRPNRHEGAKEERIDSTLIPRYEAKSIFHYHGGNCQTLEDELIQTHPPHDDIKDALAAAVYIAKSPAKRTRKHKVTNITTHPRFGGIAI